MAARERGLTSIGRGHRAQVSVVKEAMDEGCVVAVVVVWNRVSQLARLAERRVVVEVEAEDCLLGRRAVEK